MEVAELFGLYVSAARGNGTATGPGRHANGLHVRPNELVDCPTQSLSLHPSKGTGDWPKVTCNAMMWLLVGRLSEVMIDGILGPTNGATMDLEVARPGALSRMICAAVCCSGTAQVLGQPSPAEGLEQSPGKGKPSPCRPLRHARRMQGALSGSIWPPEDSSSVWTDGSSLSP